MRARKVVNEVDDRTTYVYVNIMHKSFGYKYQPSILDLIDVCQKSLQYLFCIIDHALLEGGHRPRIL